MVLMLVMFGTAQPSLLAFPEERPVFLREYSTDHYVVGAYFVSRLVLEAVITFVQVMLAVSRPDGTIANVTIGLSTNVNE